MRRHLPLIAVLAASVALQARVFLLVKHYSVNILYWDQWEFYEPLFEGMPISRFFLWQVGPVRQGIGFLVYKYVSELSDWDTRVETIVISALIFIALLSALWLKRRLLGPLTYSDLAIPTLFMSPVMIGLYTITPNPSHGAFPLLLAVLYCVGWSFRGRLKYPAILLTNFLLIFTGFGLFMGFITPPLLALDCYRAARRGERAELAGASLALLLSLASLASFFVGYVFSPSLKCFQFPHPEPSAYLCYVCLMFASFWRFGGPGLASYVVGSVLTAAVVVLFARHAYLLLRGRSPDRRVSIIITALTAFSLLFSLNAAIGRVCMGLHTAQAARYLPYLIPAFLALYFELLLAARSGRLERRAALGGFLLASALLVSPLTRSGAVVQEQFRRGKSAWKQCYIDIENVLECNARSNFEIYPTTPGPSPPKGLEEKLS